MEDLVYSILKELFEGKLISMGEIDSSIRAGEGLTRMGELKKAYDTIMWEKYIEPVDPGEPQNMAAKNKISSIGINAYKTEKALRDANINIARRQKWENIIDKGVRWILPIVAILVSIGTCHYGKSDTLNLQRQVEQLQLQKADKADTLKGKASPSN
jgi:hypothetical protein